MNLQRCFSLLVLSYKNPCFMGSVYVFKEEFMVAEVAQIEGVSQHGVQ
jgi:hypothetical protein